MSEVLDQNIHKLLSSLNSGEGMRCFKKKLYLDFFQKYRSSVEDVNEEIMKMFGSPEKDSEMESAADSLVSYAKDKMEKALFFKRSAVLVDMQCMMVFYVLPGILKILPEEDSRRFADMICAKWHEAFPKENINAATADEIYDGFRTTIFGFNVEGMFGGK